MVRSSRTSAGRDGGAGASGVPLPASVSARVDRSAGLARAHRIIDGVWSLQLPLCYESVASVNAYLLAADGGWLMVDCGSCLDPGWAAVEVALAQAGVRIEQVRTLVLTHAHADHRGLARAVAEQTGCEIATGAGPHPFLDRLRDPSVPLPVRRARALIEGVPDVAVDRMVDDLPGADDGYPEVPVDRVLPDGDVLESDTGPWQAVAAPGHSADQILLWNARHRMLISADAALAGPASYLEYGTRPDPHADQLATLDRVLGLAPDRLLPGHGRPVAGAVDFLAGCRLKVTGRADGIRRILCAEPRSAWRIAAGITPPGADAGHWQRSLAEALAVLEHLERRGAARHVLDDRGVRAWLSVTG